VIINQLLKHFYKINKNNLIKISLKVKRTEFFFKQILFILVIIFIQNLQFLYLKKYIYLILLILLCNFK
jgi:hypothetical protein